MYRDKIVPLLREDPKKAIPELESALKPGASAVFDFTLGTVHFQTEDFTNAVKHYEAALAKFPDYRRAQRNLALALVRDAKFEQAVDPLTRTIALGGANSKIYGLLGFAHLNAGRLVFGRGRLPAGGGVRTGEHRFQARGLVKAQIGLSKFNSAVALLDELLQEHPERDNLWALQANVFIQQEDAGQGHQ